MGLFFNRGGANQEVNQLHKEAQQILKIDKHQIELDEALEEDLEEIHGIIQKDGNAIEAIAETDNIVDLGRNMERHNVQRSLPELENDFRQLHEDIKEVMGIIEEKRKELRQEVNIEEDEEIEFNKLGNWSEKLESALNQLEQAQDTGGI